MKRMFTLLVTAMTLLSLFLLPVYGLEHAEWDATAWEDGNYGNFYGDGNGFIAELVMDGGLSTAWQKEQGAMNNEGYFEKECFVALSWEDVMKINSVNIWWRSSSRAEASTDGYTVQIGTGDGQNVTWTDIAVRYVYNADDEEDGYYICDTVTFPEGTETKHIRVVIKRGVDYVDKDRMYSPKVCELEVNADMSLNQPEKTEEPVPSEEPTPSVEPTEQPAPTPDKPTPSATPAPSATPSADTETDKKPSDMLGWYIVIGLSVAVMAASGVILLTGRKK